MNILLTSAGRRSSLLRFFQTAVAPLGGQVIVSEIDGLAPTLYHADKVIKLPHVNAPGYAESLLAGVRQFDIELIVPTIDTELAVLADLRCDLARAGAHLVLSSHEFCAIAGDKWLTHTMCLAHDLASPASWLPEAARNGHAAALPTKLFVKPRQGSASQDCFALTKPALEGVLETVPLPIVQECLSGEELTIDAFFDLTGSPLHYVPRKRLKTLAGESVEGVTVDDTPFREWLLKTLAVFGERGARGPITFQAFLTERGPVLTDINPRFGGGFPLAHAAGAYYPEWLIALQQAQMLPDRLGQYERGVYMTRSYQETFVRQPKW